MTMDSVTAAYAPFVASLLAGGFRDPADGGWPAELVAAHVSRNNDLIAATAEQVAEGAEVTYDNASTIDVVEVAAYATSVGGLAGLAGEIERSAARLAAARDGLGAMADTPVHVIIRDGDTVVQDGPIPIGAFIDGNASFHLRLHHEQLKAPRATDWALCAAPDEFDTYQLVLLVRPPDQPRLEDEASAAARTPASGALPEDAGRRVHDGRRARRGRRRDQPASVFTRQGRWSGLACWPRTIRPSGPGASRSGR